MKIQRERLEASEKSRLVNLKMHIKSGHIKKKKTDFSEADTLLFQAVDIRLKPPSFLS